MFRYSPCNCLANTISCSNNENCKKYANLSAENNSKIAKQRFWTVHKLVKIVQTHNSDTMQSYYFHVFNIQKMTPKKNKYQKNGVKFPSAKKTTYFDVGVSGRHIKEVYF